MSPDGFFETKAFFFVFFTNAQKRDTKKSSKTTEGEQRRKKGRNRKKTRNPTLFVICLEKQSLFRVFELPLLRSAARNAQKKKKKPPKETTGRQIKSFFWGLRFRHFCYGTPWLVQGALQKKEATCLPTHLFF
jgi:hypothetical protein